MLHLTHRPSGERLALKPTETVRLPPSWGGSVILAFEGYDERLKDADPEDYSLREYHLGFSGGYVTGLIRAVPAPSWIAYSAARLLDNAVFTDLVFPKDEFGVKRRDPLWVHKTGWLPEHDNLWQIPQGQIGGGSVVVRDVTTLAYGRKTDLPTSQLEKKALLMSHTRKLLEALNYESLDSAGGHLSTP